MAITDPQVCVHGLVTAFGPCPYCMGVIGQPVTFAPPPVPTGWRCICGRGYAPWVPMCHFCPPLEQPAFIGKAGDDPADG